jgi:hypothetical protein
MNDPEIHSTTREWDMAETSAQWTQAHNYSHHTYALSGEQPRKSKKPARIARVPVLICS